MASKPQGGVSGETIWMDGEFINWSDANIHILTHTLHYGLGVFEGIRCYRTDDGRSAVFRLPEHLRRLYDSAKINLLEVPFDQGVLHEAVLESLRRNHLTAGYIRPLVFIGDGAMGLHPGDNPIRVAIISWAWGKYLGEEGMARGISAKILTAKEIDVVMDFDSLRNAGSMAGSGGVIVMDETTCIVEALGSAARFFADESCGQCSPCREGTGWVHRILNRIVSGQGTIQDLDDLLVIAGGMEGTTICVFADAAAWPVQSYITKFRHEFEEYIRTGQRAEKKEPVACPT